MVSIQIKDQLIAKIAPLSSVQVVYPALKLNPSGFPAVFITANTEEGEFSSNAENSRVYTYNCMVLFPLGQDFVPEAERERLDYAERTIAQVIDDIINAIDSDFELDGNPVLFVNAADVEWGYTDFEGGAARAANVILKVYTEVTI
jgi:hypothetical protein